MITITGGRVSYGRTVKTGEYENKRMDVALDFGISDDDTSYEELVAMAGRIALKQCHELLGLKAPATPSAPKLAPATAAAPAAPPAGDDESKKRGLGRPSTKVKLTPPPAAEAAPEDTGKNPANDELDEILSAPETVKEITDVNLMTAIKERNAEISNPTAIKKLAAEHGAQAGMQITSMPQEKRLAFLEALKGLKPLA